MMNLFGKSVNTVVLPDYTEALIFESVRKMEKIQQDDDAKRRAVSLQFYYNYNIQDEIGRYFSDKTRKTFPIADPKVVPRFARARMMLYKYAPERFINGEVDEKYNELAFGLDYNARVFSELAWLLGDCGFLSYYDRKMERLSYQPITDYTLYYVDGERYPFAVSYPINKEWWVFWSESRNGQKGFHFKFKKDGKPYPVGNNEDMINPYDLMPFTMVENQSDSWDVVSAAKRFGVACTEYEIAHRFSAGSPYAIGIDVGQMQDFEFGIDKMSFLPEGASLGFATPGTNLESMINSAKSIIDIAAQNNHLRIKWAEGGNAPSGEALRIMEFENIESRESDIVIFDRWEHERFEVDRRILEIHGHNIGEDYSINWAEVSFPKSAQEEREEWSWKLETGLAGPEDYYRWLDPDASDEMIDEKVEGYWERRGKNRDVTQPAQPKSPFELLD